MTQRFPDIEIYIFKADAQAVKNWLTQALNTRLEEIKPHHWQATIKQQTLDILFTPNAEKNFTSLWFKQNLTPWDNDDSCAQAAHCALNTEIRCQASSWQETENESAPQEWIKYIHGQAKRFIW